MKNPLKYLLLYLYIYGYKAHKKGVEWLMAGLTFTQLLAEAFWLAVLPSKAIAAIDAFHYSRSSKYKGKNFNATLLSNWEQAMVDTYFTKCKTLMVLAAGGGREVYALLKAGYQVDGYECNPVLVQDAKKWLKAEGYSEEAIEVVPPSHAPNNGKIYDAVILGWGAYIHVKGRAARIQLLREIAAHLNSGAPFMLSYWYAHSYTLNYCRKLYKVNRFFCRLFFTRPIEQGERLAPFSARYFTHEEIAAELSEAGFTVLYQQSEPYGHTVAQKNIL